MPGLFLKSIKIQTLEQDGLSFLVPCTKVCFSFSDPNPLMRVFASNTSFRGARFKGSSNEGFISFDADLITSVLKKINF